MGSVSTSTTVGLPLARADSSVESGFNLGAPANTGANAASLLGDGFRFVRLPLISLVGQAGRQCLETARAAAVVEGDRPVRQAP